MLIVRRMLTLLIAITSGVLFSQAPELSQQYRQRLGGAVDELTIRIQDFDVHANHNGLDREEALGIYARSPEEFIRSQGEAIRQTFDRYERLSSQLEELVLSSPILRPLVVARRLDTVTFSNALRDFVPAVPLSAAGAVWAGLGLVAGLLAALILLGILRSLFVLLGRIFGGRRARTVTSSTSGSRSNIQRIEQYAPYRR